MPGKIGVVASNFPSRIAFHCIIIGISPLTLRNDTLHFDFRTQVERDSNQPLTRLGWLVYRNI
ncbi:MAG: hypothetical protein KDJ65_40980, partial [Anaerolineae bacterium]|nr:hypothetical protein [Anaerolineae bacterium]